MPVTHLGTNSDLPAFATIIACVLAALSIVMLIVEMRRRERGGVAIASTGIIAILALVTAVLRPVRIAAKESVVGPRVVILADASRSMALKDGSALRSDVRDKAVAHVQGHAKDARLQVVAFGDGSLAPFAAGAPAALPRSDLSATLRALAKASDETPQAVVVISDGRLDDPPEGSTEASLADLAATLHAPIHTIATTHVSPKDASIRHVSEAGAAVAHVPLPLRIDVGCVGLACDDDLTITAKELREDGAPALLASGLAKTKDGKATLDLTVTLERAGLRILEIAVSSPPGDAIPENDRRLIPIFVSRERVRVLHVAGRPTNDVRALRQWLKSDASVDTVAFFILRTPTDNVNASSDELALIPFPVDELFAEHLPSFDAVVLQDFDAQPYGLERHLPALANYVRTGGGLIMVGGPNSFVAGGYANTPLAAVLPVALDGSSGATAADTAPLEPQWTENGRAAPMLGPVRGVLGEQLPQMPGANVLGDVRPGGVALWTHPTRKTPQGSPMPVLAVGDIGNGRTIALGLDGGWMLTFSDQGARTGGRAHGALSDGLLGWLMRDPRFEPAQVELASPCIANEPSTLRLKTPPSGAKANVKIDVTRMDGDAKPVHVEKSDVQLGAPIDIALPAMPQGGYSARVVVGSGTTTRGDFACEPGGEEWADSRPDEDRLRAIATATGGSFSRADSLADLPLPKPTVVSAERHVTPLAPPWAWALLAAITLGAHWYARRRGGLS